MLEMRLEVAPLAIDKPSMFHTLSGSPRDIIQAAARIVRTTAERLGVSPRALDWSVTAGAAA